MSSTNHTANYNLSQFVGSDKPTWLGDINQDMYAIDAQMKTNADNITTASGAVTELGTTVSGLSSTVSTVQSDLNTTSALANTNAGNISTLTSALNAFKSSLTLSNFTSVAGSSINIHSSVTTSGTLYLAQSSDSASFKLYGTFYMTRSSSSTVTINKTAITGMSGYYGIDTGLTLTTPPSEAFTIASAGTLHRMAVDNSSNKGIYAVAIAIGTDGHIYLEPSDTQAWTLINNAQDRRIYPPCLYFNTNFGDTDSE